MRVRTVGRVEMTTNKMERMNGYVTTLVAGEASQSLQVSLDLSKRQLLPTTTIREYSGVYTCIVYSRKYAVVLALLFRLDRNIYI